FIYQEERLCGLLERSADVGSKGVVPDQAAVRNERSAVDVLVEVTKQIEIRSSRIVDVPVGDLLVRRNRDTTNAAAVTDGVTVVSTKLVGSTKQVVCAVVAISNAPLDAIAVLRVA